MIRKIKMTVRELLHHPRMNMACHKYKLLGKLLCKLNLNHSLYITGLRSQPFNIVARCRYCGKEFEGVKK